MGWRACIWEQPEASWRKPDSPQFLIFFTTLQSYFDNDANIFYSKNIIPIRSNKSKTFLICNQALRVPTEICDSNNISVCIKSRVDNLFKFLCSSAALKLLLLKSLLLLLSLPNLYKCFSFAQPGIPPHFRCLSYSIYSLIASSCIEGTCRRWNVRAKERHESNRQSQWGSLVGSDKCHCVASTQSCWKVKRVQHRLVKSHKGKIKQRE